jgi:predicted NUDIX family NTP pyrophosphohydrolase
MITSAGVLLYRTVGGRAECLLVHPGGPFWARKDLGSWSIPKGEHEAGEPAEAAARRELEEEIGLCWAGELLPLGEARQPSRKLISAFAARADFDCATLRSNPFEMEWPRRSGRMQRFPEIDRAAWFDLDEARRRILPGQAVFIDRLEALLSSRNACEQAGGTPEASATYLSKL